MRIALESSLDVLDGQEVRNRLENPNGDIYKLLQEVYSKGIEEVFLYRPTRVVEIDNMAFGDRVKMRSMGNNRLRFSYIPSNQRLNDFDHIIVGDLNGDAKKVLDRSFKRYNGGSKWLLRMKAIRLKINQRY